MAFKPIQQLGITRILSTGKSVKVGTLAQNSSGVFFQYGEDYLSTFCNLSPFSLEESFKLQKASPEPHKGLHGLFADHLPDGWGLLLQDRLYRQQGILPAEVTQMDRLAFVGKKGMGALQFEPESPFTNQSQHEFDLETLGLEAQQLFDRAVTDELDGNMKQVLEALVAGGSSGGARPKALIFVPPDDFSVCRTYEKPGDEAWLVKFTSKNLALGHEEGLCEAAYLAMAELAGCQPPIWRLLPAPESSGAEAWLAVKRFDHVMGEVSGRLHMHSACGLLDADFRTPSLDYVELIKASRQLCKSPAVGRLQFRRAVFNLFAANQDDHTKNWSFLQRDDGQWSVAPFYDATFSPHPFNQHATAFGGYGSKPPLNTMEKLAIGAGFSSWQEAKPVVREVLDAVSQFDGIAKSLGVSQSTITAIKKTLHLRKNENKALL